MARRAKIAGLVGAAVLMVALIPQSIAAPAPPAGDEEKGLRLFRDHVRPVLIANCLKCHGGEKVRGGLDMATRGGLLHPGDSGPVVVPGDHRKSLLWRLVSHLEDPHMPEKGEKLSDASIAKIAEWIDAGAPYDRPLIEKAGALKGKPNVTEEDRKFWSYAPLGRYEPPKVRDEKGWVRTEVDRFVLAKLEEKGIAPNGVAERRKLIRRAYFDLLGLPPTPKEVKSFLADTDSRAYEKLVDRLLERPEYGERWGRHWLDLARFAESHGYEQDYDRPNAYHYRDFVIKALNADMPYDQFVKWQIAGDEIAPEDPLALAATGYLAGGTHATQITASQAEKERYDELDDMAGNIGTTMLGMTIACARCHDHKFDPIPTKDYYRFISAFTTTVRSDLEINQDPSGFARVTEAYEKELARLVEAVRKYESEELIAKARAWAQSGKKPRLARWGALAYFRANDAKYQQLDAAVKAHVKKKPVAKKAKVLVSSEGVPAVRLHTQGPDFYEKTYFLKRGDLSQKDGEATLGFPQVLVRSADGEKKWLKSPPKGWRTSYRRTALAEWLTDTEQGAGHLLARVMVNRLWQHHMGRGIVSTPNDFGQQGERPTHPELLDWLAGKLIEGGWRLKPLHRFIMTSSVYMQGSEHDATRAAADVDNVLMWRRGYRRLEAEAIRDAMLAVSGMLDRTMYGPGTLDESMKRRSIYFFTKRSKLIPLMVLFDAPDSLAGIGQRPATTVAPQALALMNNPQVQSYAKGLAKRVMPKDAAKVPSAVREVYWIALSREPSAEEMADGVAFIEQQAQAGGLAGAMAAYCQAILCLNEFVYVD